MNEKRIYLDSLRDALSGFQLNEAETAVYGAALQLGTRQASKIAKTAGLNRAYTYDILASLKSKGLVQEGVRNKVRHYTCTPPEHLLALLAEREKEVAVHRHTLEKALPQLVALQSQFVIHGNYVRWFQGTEASESLLDTLSKSATGVVRCALSGEALEANRVQRMLTVLQSKEEVSEIKLLSCSSAHQALDAAQRMSDNCGNALSKRNLKQSIRKNHVTVSHIDIVLANEALHLFVAEPKPLSLIISHPALQFSATELFETIWMRAQDV